MTNDPGGDLRDRFRTASLPPAPVRLRERLVAVASTPIATTRPRFAAARLLIAAAAVFAIASIGLVVSGGIDDPGPSPSALTAEATVEPTVEATHEPTAEPFPFRLVCEEAEAPALTCEEVALRLLDELNMEVADSGTIATIEVTRPCDMPCPPAANFVVTFVSGSLVDGSIGPGELFQMMSSETAIPTEGPTEASEP
jgi:hypothetical protein